jgi:hypothetical protein
MKCRTVFLSFIGFLAAIASTPVRAEPLQGFEATHFRIQCGPEQAPSDLVLSGKFDALVDCKAAPEAADLSLRAPMTITVGPNTYAIQKLAGFYASLESPPNCANVDFLHFSISNEFAAYNVVISRTGVIRFSGQEQPAILCQGIATATRMGDPR